MRVLRLQVRLLVVTNLVEAVLELMAEDLRPAPTWGVRNIEGSLPSSQHAVSSTTVSAHFKMIFLAVFSLTAALLVTRVGVGIMVANPTDSLKDAMSTCNLLGNAGFGAILGLIGGKVV